MHVKPCTPGYCNAKECKRVQKRILPEAAHSGTHSQVVREGPATRCAYEQVYAELVWCGDTLCCGVDIFV